MLRKLTHIMLALFLVVATMGVTFSMHYCHGELVSTSINKATKTCCDGNDGCCQNKTLHFKVKEDYTSPAQVETNKIVQLDVLLPVIYSFYFELLPQNEIVTEVFIDTSPPPNIQTRLALLQTYLC